MSPRRSRRRADLASASAAKEARAQARVGARILSLGESPVHSRKRAPEGPAGSRASGAAPDVELCDGHLGDVDVRCRKQPQLIGTGTTFG
jgi:hypothetical protein